MSTFTGGLASGIDTASLITGLVAAATKPLTVIKAQQADVQAKQDAYDTLSSRLDSLSTALADLDTVQEFRSVTGRSADDTALGVSVAGDAVVGTFRVQIDQLASASMTVSEGMASRSAESSLAQGTWHFTVGGTTTDVTIGAADANLDDLVAAINDQVAGVTAFVMDTGDATNPYRLVVTGDDTGLDNAVTIDTTDLDGATGTVPTMTETTAACDALLQVNGILISASTNEIDTAVQGVTFTAQEVTTSPVTVTVGRDTDAMVTKMAAVITAYNAVTSYVREQKVYNPDEGLKGAFVGESQANTVTEQLQSLMASQFSGLGALDTLASLGITTARNGDLELDEDKLHTVLNSNFEDVVSLFTDSSTGVAASITALVETFTGDEGTVTLRSESLGQQVDTMDDRIADFQDQLDTYEARLQKQFTNMEIAMARFQTSQAALLSLMPDTSSNSG